MCSAACSVPSSRGIVLEALEHLRLGRYQIASVSNVVSRQVERRRCRASTVRESLVVWYATTCSVTETRPKRSSSAEPPLDAQRLLDRRSASPSSPACTSRRSNGSTTRAPRVAGRARGTRYWLAEVEVDRALVHGRVGALALGQPQYVARSTRPRRGMHRARCDRSGTRAAGASLPAQTQPRGRVAQLRHVRRPLERLRAERRRRRLSSTGASNAAAATCPSSTRGLAWSRIAAST